MFNLILGDVCVQEIQPGFFVLPGFALACASGLKQAVEAVVASSGLRRMQVPSGHTMSVQTTSCGDYGWVSDHNGYRYARHDPDTGQPWPAMPDIVRQLAVDAAQRCGFLSFEPDSCLINCYQPGAKMGLHQDKDEQDFAQPIVSVSLGLPATFLLGGLKRSDKTSKMTLCHGDVLVWGGVARLRYHGILPVNAGEHPLTGACRINLTIRKAY